MKRKNSKPTEEDPIDDAGQSNDDEGHDAGGKESFASDSDGEDEIIFDSSEDENDGNGESDEYGSGEDDDIFQNGTQFPDDPSSDEVNIADQIKISI